MKIFKNLKRFDNYILYNDLKHNPYNYERYGLINHLMSKSIYNTNNSITKFIINMFDKHFIFIMKYIDVLKNFNNIYNKNR